jgi:hypothetical protein
MILSLSVFRYGDALGGYGRVQEPLPPGHGTFKSSNLKFKFRFKTLKSQRDALGGYGRVQEPLPPGHGSFKCSNLKLKFKLRNQKSSRGHIHPFSSFPRMVSQLEDFKLFGPLYALTVRASGSGVLMLESLDLF